MEVPFERDDAGHDLVVLLLVVVVLVSLVVTLRDDDDSSSILESPSVLFGLSLFIEFQFGAAAAFRERHLYRQPVGGNQFLLVGTLRKILSTAQP